MLDMGFEPQIRSIIEGTLRVCHSDASVGVVQKVESCSSISCVGHGMPEPGHCP